MSTMKTNEPSGKAQMRRIGGQIKQLRESRGMSLDAFCRISALTPGRLARIEAGEDFCPIRPFNNIINHFWLKEGERLELESYDWAALCVGESPVRPRRLSSERGKGRP